MDGIYILPIIGTIGKDFKYTDVLLHLNAAKDSQYIKLIIDSPGGSINEGDKIKEALVNSGKVMFSANSGDVASYAVSLFNIAPKQNRVYDPAKGVFLIHMPLVLPEDGVSGTAADLEIIAKELKKIQNNIIADYVKSTGSDADVLAGFMNENVPLTPEQVETLGFATVQNHPVEIKAVAYYTNSNIMTNEENVKKLGVIESLLNKVVAFFEPKNLMVQDTAGKELDFGPEVQTIEQVIIGVKATVEGAPAEGDFVLETGETYRFAAGILTEIVPPTPAPDAEKEQLKTDLAEAQAKLASVSAEMSKFKAEFLKFKNEFSEGDPLKHVSPPGDDEPTVRKAFKTKN